MGIPAATPALFFRLEPQVRGRTMFGPVFIKISRPAAAAHCAGRRLQAGSRMPVRYRGRRHMPRLESAPCAACHDLRVLIASLIRHGQQERGGGGEGGRRMWRRWRRGCARMHAAAVASSRSGRRRKILWRLCPPPGHRRQGRSCVGAGCQLRLKAPAPRLRLALPELRRKFLAAAAFGDRSAAQCPKRALLAEASCHCRRGAARRTPPTVRRARVP